jgi:hypothetical protein
LAGNGEKYRDLNSLRLQLRDAITGGNPQHPYQQALDAYSGPSNSISAVREGQSIFNKEPDEIAAEMARLSPSDREFYRLGAAGTLRKNLGSRPGDESKTIVGKDYRQQQLRPLFDTQSEYDRFINSATAENRMFDTKQKFLGGSQTAERMAEDNAPEGAMGHAVRAGVAAMEGAPGAAGLSAMKALGAITRGESPAVNAAPDRPASVSDPAGCVGGAGAENGTADDLYPCRRRRWCQSGPTRDHSRGLKSISAVVRGASLACWLSRYCRRIAGPPPNRSIKRVVAQMGAMSFRNNCHSIEKKANQCSLAVTKQ